MRRWALLAVFMAAWALLCAGSALAGYEAGIDAFARGDYDLAYDEWIAAGRGGDVRAQYRLGVLHMVRQWTGANDEVAFLWMLRAAEQGYEMAQTAVAGMYERGIGVAPDAELARQWTARSLAASGAGEPRGHGVRERRAAATPEPEYARAPEPRPLSGEESLALGEQADAAPGADARLGGGVAAPKSEAADRPMPEEAPSGALLRERSAQAERENQGLSELSCWVVDPGSACLVWFQRLREGEFVRWSGGCDAAGYAHGQGVLTFKTLEDEHPVRYEGPMVRGRTGTGGEYTILRDQ
jgi:hypothetical protein